MASHVYESRVGVCLAQDSVGVGGVLGYVLSGVAPLLVSAGLITSIYAVTGMTAIPFMLLVVAVLLVVFFAGFLSMARYVPNAGAFYSYVALGLGRPAGVAAAAVAWTGYNLLTVGLYGVFGPQLAALLAEHGPGWDLPWWLWALAVAAVVGFLGTRQVRWVSRLLGVLIVVEVAVILVLSARGLARPAPGVRLWSGLSPAGLTGAAAAVCGAGAVLCFVGSESAPVYREEAKHATRTITAATVIALVLMTLTYLAAPWAMTVHYGPTKVVDVARQQGPGMLFTLGGTGRLATVAQVLFLTSAFAAMMAFHNAATRYTFVLGRERVLPSGFERTNRHGAPWAASLLQTGIALAVIVVYAVKGWDPMVKLFFWGGQTGGFLILLLMATTSIAVVGFFRRNRAEVELRIRDVPVWRRLIAPVVAAAGLWTLAWLVWRNYSALLGEPTSTRASTLLPALAVVAVLLGLLRAWWLHARRPEVYWRIARDRITLPDQTRSNPATPGSGSSGSGSVGQAGDRAAVEGVR